MSAAFNLNSKEVKRELKFNYNNEILPRAQIPRGNVGQVAHLSPIPWVTSQEADISRRVLEAACWLRLGCWSNNISNGHLSPGAFHRRILRSCLVSQCSHPPYLPCHQRRLENCDWMPASYTSGPAELRRNGAAVSLTRCALELGHLLHSALTRPSSANARRLKSRYPFLPAEQQLISSSTTTTYVRRSGRITNGTRSGRTTPQDTALQFQTPVHTHPEWPSQEQPGSGLTASAPVSAVSAPASTNGVWPPLRQVSVAQKNKPSTMLPSNVHPSTPS